MENRFGKRLKEVRKEKGIGQVELAKMLGVSNGTISLWENGLRIPGITVIYSLCEIFHESADYMLGITEY